MGRKLEEKKIRIVVLNPEKMVDKFLSVMVPLVEKMIDEEEQRAEHQTNGQIPAETKTS